MSSYNDNNPPSHYRAGDEEMYSHFSEMESHLDMGQFPTSSSHIHPHPHPHPHPLFTRQENMNSNSNLNRSLDPQALSHHSVYHSPPSFSNIQDQIHSPNQESPHGWPLYDQSIPHNFSQPNPSLSPISYNPGGYPSSSPFPPTRLSPPPLHLSVQFKGQVGPNVVHSGINTSSHVSNHRPILAGSLDPATGIFYRTPEHPRLRTAQACEKCRTRKAKCSGEHPSCKRCLTRGLVCEYAKEGRVRGPNKPKPGKNGASVSTIKKNSIIAANVSAESSVASSHFHEAGRLSSRARAVSAHSNSSGSSEYLPEQVLNSTALQHALLPSGVKDLSNTTSPIFATDGRSNSVPGYQHLRRDSLSLSGHRSSRPRPLDLQLDTASNLFRLSMGNTGRPSSMTRDISSSTGGLLPSPFQRHPPHLDEAQHYHAQARETTFAVENGGHVTHPHEFAPQVNQAQIREFQRSVFSGNRGSSYANTNNGHSLSLLSPVRTASIHHSRSHDMLNMDVSQIDVDLGTAGDEFLYPSPETYVHPQQEHHERFQQRSYERGGRGGGERDEEDTSMPGYVVPTRFMMIHGVQADEQLLTSSQAYTATTLPGSSPTSLSCLGSPHTDVNEHTGRGTVGPPTASTLLAEGVAGNADEVFNPRSFSCHPLQSGADSSAGGNKSGHQDVSNGSEFDEGKDVVNRMMGQC